MLSRARARAIVASKGFQLAVVGTIFANAIAVGLESSPTILERHGTALRVAEILIVIALCVELGLRLWAEGKRFFRSGWNWFDLLIVLVALIPAVSHLRVLRVLRVLQLARLVSILPSLRRIVSAMMSAVPSIFTVIMMLGVALYSGAVIGTHLFSDVDEYFGSLGRSMFTMFEIMTIGAWPDVAAAVMDKHPAGWIFFVIYLVIVGFIMLNLLIGVIVSAMETEVNRERLEADQELERIQYEAIMAKLERIERRLGPEGSDKGT